MTLCKAFYGLWSHLIPYLILRDQDQDQDQHLSQEAKAKASPNTTKYPVLLTWQRNHLTTPSTIDNTMTNSPQTGTRRTRKVPYRARA